jgi:hypothetical protein
VSVRRGGESGKECQYHSHYIPPVGSTGHCGLWASQAAPQTDEALSHRK